MSKMLSSLNLQNFKYWINTIDLAKNTTKYLKLNAPDNYKFATLYKYYVNEELKNAHNALNNVLETAYILTFTQFWNRRKENMKCVN